MNDQKIVSPIREGFRAITPYLFAQDAAHLIEFISKAFGGEETYRKNRPDGAAIHAEMRVGDCMLMLGGATPQFGPMPASIYLYVTDSDSVYQRALRVGGVWVLAIMTPHNGERYGGVKDPFGNIGRIATNVEDVRRDEEERRWKEFRMP